jgi:acetamidase/formamidase
MTGHRLDPTPETTRDVFSRDHAPVLTVDPGDTVTVGSLDASGYLARQTFPGQAQPTMFPEARGHCLTGPIEVRGARPGDMLALRLLSLRPGDWGWTVAGARDTPVTRRLGLAGGSPSWLLWELDPDAGQGRTAEGFSRPLAPFLGVMGMPPAEPGEHSTIPPRPCGGNIDCRELVGGSSLLLPVAVPGALLSAGDGHGAQGDGEVSGTAIECPMEVCELTLVLHPDVNLAMPRAETPAGWLTFGFDADLNEAMAVALDAMVDLMAERLAVGRREALALASVTVDLRITQVANETWGVHAVLPPGAIGRG